MSTVIAGKPTPMSDVAERFETVVKEKRDLACRLSQALDEMNAINQLYRERSAEFVAEKTLLESEIEKLRAVVAESSKNQEKRTADSAAVRSILEAREKLIREEFSRKFQDLAVEVKRQRTKYDEQVGEMKKKLSACICQPSDRKTLHIVAAPPDHLVDYRKSGRL
jgi:hypothetical protein